MLKRSFWLGKLRDLAAREWALYAVATLICVAVLVKVFALHHKDLSAPLYFDEYGDALYYFMQMKVLLETGWVYEHPGLGAPYGMTFYDFPHFDALHLFVCKLIGLAFPNWAVVVNLFFLLTFVFTTWTTLYLLRYLQVPGPIAVALALLYAFQHYHLHRGQGHLMLAAYYHLPLFVLVMAWLLEPGGLTGAARGLLRSRRFWAAVVICALGAVGGHYYAAFAVGFFLLMGLYQLARLRAARPLWHAAIVSGVVVAAFAANLVPNYLYWQKNGANRVTSQKNENGPEVYGLKVTQMLLPVPAHRVPRLAELSHRYYTTSPSINENSTSHIGAVAAAGYVLLLGVVLFPFVLAPREGLGLHALAVASLVGTLIATTGGLMSLFGYLVTPQMHGVNRMSIFLALFALIAVGLCLAAWLERVRSPGARAKVGVAVAAVLIGAGLLDQVSPCLQHNLARADALHERDAAFGGTIQATLPEGSRLFLLPVGGFPGPAYRAGDNGPVPLLYYDYIRTYLHTNGIHLNQPCMLNRRGASWNLKASRLPPEQMLDALALAGFSGVVVDAKAKEKVEQDLVAWLERHVGPAAAHDGVSRHFFDIRAYVARRRQSVPAAEWERRIAEVLPPTEVSWGPSFQPEETNTKPPEWRRFRWSIKSSGEIYLFNESAGPVQAHLGFTLYSARGDTATFTVSGGLMPGGQATCAYGERWEQVVTVPPGRHTLTVRGAGLKPLRTPEGRRVWFRVEGLDFNLARPE